MLIFVSQTLVVMIVLSVVCLQFQSSVADTIFVKIGADATFLCPFMAKNYEIVWRGPQYLSLYSTNENVNLARTQYKRIKIAGNFTAGEYILIIENFSKDDEGLYACDSIEDGKGVQHFISALVAEKPSLLENQRNLTFKAEVETKTRFSILVKSYEKPEVTWIAMLDGGKRGFWEINPLNGTVFKASSIIIPEIRSHFGIYGLKIRNSAGSIDINIKLITSNFVQVTQSHFICNTSAELLLSCYLKSNPDNITVSNAWTHTYHGVILRTFRGNIQGNISTLSINFCVYMDAGNYTCKWILDNQQYSATSSVTVNSYPLFLKKRIASLNGHLLLEVTFYSEPKSDYITWYHNYDKIDGNKKYNSTVNEVPTELTFYGKTIKTTAYLAMLSISDYKSDQGLANGAYSCHIKNVFGFIEESFDEIDIANASVVHNQDVLSYENDIHKIIWMIVWIACSAALTILFTSIGMIIAKSRKKQIYHTPNLNDENNATQDLINLSHNHGTSSGNYHDEYEEIESTPTPAVEQESLNLSYESSDDSEVLPKVVCTGTQPINVYEDLHHTTIELHTYRQDDHTI